MNNKLISSAAGIFGYGVLVGWALTADRRERLAKEEREKQDFTIKTLRMKNWDLETAVNHKDGLLKKVLASDKKNLPEEETEETDVTDEEDDVNEEELETTRSNLQGLIDNYTQNPDDRDTFVDLATSAVYDERPPFVISREKFAWDDEEEGESYDKITLSYYPRHRILLDDDEETIDDVANTVGWKNLNQFGGESGDPDVVFIRNRRLSADFEVVRETERDVPLHIKYGMEKEEFHTRKAAGLIRIRPEDRD